MRLHTALSSVGRDLCAFTRRVRSKVVARGPARDICTGRIEPLEPRVVLAVINVSGIIANGTVWATGDIQRITGDAQLPAGATLTIQPGAIVKFDAFAELDLLFEGTVNAPGTAGQPIVFTSMRDDTVGGDTNGDGAVTSPGNGDWNSITFSGVASTGTLNNVEVRFGGAGGGNTGAVVVNDAALMLTNSVIRNSGSNGLRIVASNPTLTGNSFLNNVFGSAVSMDLMSNPAISGVTVANNGINGLTLDPGTLTGASSWDDPEIVYQLSGDVTVDDGATLTIVPGQIVKVAPFNDIDLFIGGTLLASGTTSQPIIFTNVRDDTVGGDTNNNGGANGPDNTYWNGITFISGSTGSVIDHAEIRYAGANAAGALALSGATVMVTNSIIRHSSTDAMVARNGSNLTASNNLIFSNSDMGLRAESGSTVVVFNNTIDGNLGGVAADGAETSLTITNNLITNSTASGVLLTNSATITARFNDVFSPAGPGTNYVGLSSLTGIDGNISSDPKYISRTLFNFGLLSGSSAIDAATSNGAPMTDFFGDMRFDDPGIANLGGGAQPFFDIGAIERQDVLDPLNLVTENVTVTPANVGVGSAITITWTVGNEQGAATGDWVDAVFASRDAVWGLDDVLVGQVPHTGGLAVGASYLSQLDTTAPASVVGDLFFIVRADARQQLRESIETDNDASDSTLLDMPALVVDTPTAAQFSASGEADYYCVTVAAGGTLLVTLDRAGLGGATELYIRKDAVPTTADFDFKSVPAVGADQELLVPTTEATTYYILALGKTVPGAPRSYDIEASFIPFGPRSVSPATAGNGGTATFIVKGGQFEALDSIMLRAPDNSTRQPIATLVQDNATVIVQFDLTGVALGSYDLVLDNNGALASLDDSVQVAVATTSQVDVQFSAPSFLRPQRAFTATITYSNIGNNDAVIPLFFVDSHGEARLGLSPDNLTNTKIDVIPPPRSGPAGILKPGESAGVTIHGELLAGAGTSIDLNLDIVRPDSSPTDTRRVTTQIDDSRDPNDIIGPLGFGTPMWIPPDTDMPFTIRFENDPNVATAPTQEVLVTQQLDADLDWSTFEFGQFGFGSTSVPLASGQQTFATQVQGMNADGSPLAIDVSGTFDIATGTINWTFRSLDPETGLLPADPFAGFLPVNDTTHRGEGFVSYFVRPLAALGNNTPLSSLAHIVFDTSEEILTPEWLNTIDAAAPVSSITTPSGNAPAKTFPLSWQGTEANGSGIATFDVFVSDNNGPFTLLLNDTTLTSTMFTGAFNHTYRFFTVATDNVGFVEAPPGTADTTLAVTLTAAVENKVTLTDNDGDVYTVKLTGPGTLKYFQFGAVSDQKGPLETISLENTKETSELIVTVVKKPGGDGIVGIGDVTITGSLGAFTAAKSDLFSSSFTASGLVKSLTVRNISAGIIFDSINSPHISLGGGAADKTAIIAGTISLAVIDSTAKIGLLKARSISFTSITAPKIGQLVTKAGALNANVTTAGPIGTISVTGGDLDGDLFAKSFGMVTITGGDFSGSLTSLTPAATLHKTPALQSLVVTGGDFTGDLRLLGAAGPISVMKFAGLGGNLGGATVAASKIASLLVTKDVSNSMILAGADLGADFSLGGTGAAADAFGAGRIGTVTIKGDVIASVLAAGLNPLDGVLHNGDAIIGGIASKIAALTIKGTASADSVGTDSYFAAGKFVPPVKIDGVKIIVANDARFFVG